ncbi:MAG: helix-turn-helix domain-containing protein [Burkholderiales bacterium]
MSSLLTWHLLAMNFGKRLAALRKDLPLTQAVLAEKVGCHVTMIRRYEANETQPTLEVIRKLAVALGVSADTLVFDEHERDPDDRLKLQFEAVSKLDEKEREAIETMIAGVLHMHDAKRWAQTTSTPAKSKTHKAA